MKGYIIAMIDVNDPDAYQEYAKRARPATEKYGGTYWVRGGRSETLEGEEAPGRVVIVEFPSYERAVEFYNSPEYQEAKSYREDAAVGRFVVVEGA
jgi:uncharacterized protein (DUF1330 family)